MSLFQVCVSSILRTTPNSLHQFRNWLWHLLSYSLHFIQTHWMEFLLFSTHLQVFSVLFARKNVLGNALSILMSNLRGEIFYSCASVGYDFGTKSVFRLHVIILPYSICAKLCGVEQNKVYLSSKYWVLFEPKTPYGLPLKKLKTWFDVDLLKNL